MRSYVYSTPKTLEGFQVHERMSLDLPGRIQFWGNAVKCQTRENDAMTYMSQPKNINPVLELGYLTVQH